ncbi:MAG: DUF4157 domain-containing protein [Blastocatellia bacterium]
MSGAVQGPVKTAAVAPVTPENPSVNQRKCACGGSAGVSGKCQSCKAKSTPVERNSVDRTTLSSLIDSLADAAFFAPPQVPRRYFATGLGHNFGHLEVEPRVRQKLQPRPSVSQPEDQLESQATPETALSQQTDSGGLIIDDDAQLGPNQMRKSQFLDQLQSAVISAADAELARVGRTALGCHYIKDWIGYYRSRPAAYVERSLHKYAPDATSASSASAYIPFVAEHIKRAVSVWAATGQITGVPEELAGRLTARWLIGAAGEVLSRVAGAISSAGEVIGGMFSNAREDRPREADTPRQIESELGQGQSLDATVRSRMESAFGHDFSHVRVHTDRRAAGLSDGLNARAFTIGSDIAFGAGEYQPGSLIGDALLAHELAHVVQQGGGVSSVMPSQQREADDNELEDDANRLAVGAVASAWLGSKAVLGNTGLSTAPRLRSGLRLSRCGKAAKTDGPMKTVTIYHAKLPGGRGSVASDVEYANSEVYNDQAKIAIKIGGQNKVPEDMPKTVLDSNQMLPLGQSASNPSPQLENLFKTQTPGEINFYYVKGFIYPPTDIMDHIAVSYPPFLGKEYVGSLMSNESVEGTFAHELGHLLLDQPAKVSHNVPPKNLMFETRYKDENELTEEQVRRMRESKFVR